MGKLFGFIGVLLAVPAAAVIITLIDEFTPSEKLIESVGVETGIDVQSNDITQDHNQS